MLIIWVLITGPSVKVIENGKYKITVNLIEFTIYFLQCLKKYKLNVSFVHRLLHYNNIDILDDEEDDLLQNQAKDKEKRKKSKTVQAKASSFKSSDGMTNLTSEKSTPEPNKNESANSGLDHENHTTKTNIGEENVTDPQYHLSLESAVEKLKKRNMLDMHTFSTTSTGGSDSTNEIVEIFTMDKEVTLTKLPKKAKINDITPVVQRLGANPSISVRTLFPGEEEMNLHANVEFTNVREITPQGWEKCATMIQYDRDTKLLWQELQRPYGNQSSFLRHLILLEKYYRSGDLILAPNASRNAINYSTSVQNRLISYEGPEKMDEPIMEPISSEFHNSHRLSGGYMLERDRLSVPSTNSTKFSTSGKSHSSKVCPPRVLKLNSGVSIIKKSPPSLTRLNLPSTSSAPNGGVKRKDGQKLSSIFGNKIFQLNEPDSKRLQTFKRQKPISNDKQSVNPGIRSASSNSPPGFKSPTQYQKAQIAAQFQNSQFQKHLRMQQEMLNRQSRGDFEPLICDMRSTPNENSPTHNLIHNLNLPKSIQVTTKPSHPIPILPKIPKSLTVIPQTVTKPSDK